MFCTKCGKELNNDAKFCDGCGMPLDGIEVKEAPKKRKKTGLIIGIIAIVLVVIIGILALIGWAAEEYLQNLNIDDYDVLEEIDLDIDEITSEDTTDDSQVSNGEYEEIFSSRNIIDSPTVFMMLDSASFAIASEDGMVEKIELGYEDDVVKEMVNTVYYPISDLTTEEIDAIDTTMRATFDTYVEDGFCSVSYNTLNDYYVITLNFSALDNSDNVKKLADFGMLTGTDVDYISMSETETGLASSGYIKK